MPLPRPDSRCYGNLNTDDNTHTHINIPTLTFPPSHLMHLFSGSQTPRSGRLPWKRRRRRRVGQRRAPTHPQAHQNGCWGLSCRTGPSTLQHKAARWKAQLEEGWLRACVCVCVCATSGCKFTNLGRVQGVRMECGSL